MGVGYGVQAVYWHEGSGLGGSKAALRFRAFAFETNGKPHTKVQAYRGGHVVLPRYGEGESWSASTSGLSDDTGQPTNSRL